MVLAAGDRVKFYTSSNLIDWAHTSDFGQLEGAHGGVWECPDLFELPDDGSYDSKKWVLVVSVGNGAPSGGSGTQYFVGDFNGGTFSNHYPAAPAKWVDYGRDNYAGVTFSDIPGRDGRRIFIHNMFVRQSEPHFLGGDGPGDRHDFPGKSFQP